MSLLLIEIAFGGMVPIVETGSVFYRTASYLAGLEPAASYRYVSAHSVLKIQEDIQRLVRGVLIQCDCIFWVSCLGTGHGYRCP